MFASQNYMDVVSDLARKRPREGEDGSANGFTSFGEHRNKRVQCLPLRTSPKSSQPWPPSSITPLNSDSDEQLPRSHFSPWSSSPAVGFPSQQSTEMDMMDSNDNFSATGRVPTPIQPSFATQLRGQQNEWAAPRSAASSLSGLVNMGHHHEGLAGGQAVQNNRRLPSPISEAEDCMSGHESGLQGMIFDEHNQLVGQANVMQPSSPHESHGMDHPNAMMDVEAHSPTQTVDSDDPSSPSPARRGHTRSRHTINSWTLQPGMKRSFSIGYRGDCEKCRLKVPGHFNHIIIS